MSKAAREQFLAGLHVGVIAVERPDRAPLATAIWYAYQPGGEVSIFSTEGDLKVALIRAAGRFSITVQQEQFPYKYVTAEGDVTWVGPADEAEARAVAIRYLGEEVGNRFADATQHADTQTSVCIRMQPTKWLSSDFSDVIGQLDVAGA
ncbi:pyridoxamine 5'-phosphate oxidase family protein [Mycobacterium sp. 21AC1]|uniref:pyridoxamine 5'-phosphate oxidase family protein n=1 Tax=[Mycobacterium] appelbergii TaxID=2939269 RepID=UPI002938D65A|nr:pyridoxamine 5'-phosphate oxidase family protein [Mycobacterium sp. 21AC1]MDV3126542.1 pyridoxamine 5'-phosphate oxidase family protein [Mycobacterium sp. 21AC1]